MTHTEAEVGRLRSCSPQVFVSLRKCNSLRTSFWYCILPNSYSKVNDGQIVQFWDMPKTNVSAENAIVKLKEE